MNVLLKTLSGYQRCYLRQDLLSGVVIAAVSIPISMGYAQIAGLPAAYGLYGSVLPVLLFALFSTSPSLFLAWTPRQRPWWAVWWQDWASPSARRVPLPWCRCWPFIRGCGCCCSPC